MKKDCQLDNQVLFSIILRLLLVSDSINGIYFMVMTMIRKTCFTTVMIAGPLMELTPISMRHLLMSIDG